jgi:hypothetical protein
MEFMHLFEPQARFFKKSKVITGATIVFHKGPNNKLYCGVSYCCAKDMYSRKEGRKQALISASQLTISIVDGHSFLPLSFIIESSGTYSGDRKCVLDTFFVIVSSYYNSSLYRKTVYDVSYLINAINRYKNLWVK